MYHLNLKENLHLKVILKAQQLFPETVILIINEAKELFKSHERRIQTPNIAVKKQRKSNNDYIPIANNFIISKQQQNYPDFHISAITQRNNPRYFIGLILFSPKMTERIIHLKEPLLSIQQMSVDKDKYFKKIKILDKINILMKKKKKEK